MLHNICAFFSSAQAASVQCSSIISRAAIFYPKLDTEKK